MSCYLPLVHRWRRQEPLSRSCQETAASDTSSAREQTDCSHVLALRDGKGVTLSQGYGDFPHQVFVAIRHDHPTLGLSDVAYQRLHQEHTHRTRRPQPPQPSAQQQEPAGVVSLGLPLGISSLKLTHRHRRKQKTHNKGPDGDNHGGQMKSDLYQNLSKSSHNLTEAASFHNANTHQADRHYHAGRKSSLPRKAKIPSSYQYQPRPLSVDADLLMQSKDKSRATPTPPRPAGAASSRAKFYESPSSETDRMKFAHLTSPSSFMASHEADKSSSGNSSGSELTSEEYLHPAIRGRGQVKMTEVLANRGPPPRHLLPAKLRPSPPVKLHPYVALPRGLIQGMAGVPQGRQKCPTRLENICSDFYE